MSRVDDLRTELLANRGEQETWGLYTNERVLRLEQREREIERELAEIAQTKQRILKASMEAAMEEARTKLAEERNLHVRIQVALDAGLSVHIYNTGVTLECSSPFEIIHYEGETFDEAWEKWGHRQDVLACPAEPDTRPAWIYTKKTMLTTAKRQSRIVRFFLFLKSRLWNKPTVDDLVSDIKGEK